MTATTAHGQKGTDRGYQLWLAAVYRLSQPVQFDVPDNPTA